MAASCSPVPLPCAHEDLRSSLSKLCATHSTQSLRTGAGLLSSVTSAQIAADEQDFLTADACSYLYVDIVRLAIRYVAVTRQCAIRGSYWECPAPGTT